MSYIDVITNSIDKHSRRVFESTILKYSEHYRLSIDQQNERVKVILLCQCGTKMSIYRRDESSSFILSNYYAHLSQSTCSVMRQILKHDKRIDSHPSDSSTDGQIQPSMALSRDEDLNGTSSGTNESSSVTSYHGVSMKTGANKRKPNQAISSPRSHSSPKKRRRKMN